MSNYLEINGQSYKEDDVLEAGIRAIASEPQLRKLQQEAQANYDALEARFEDDSYEESFNDTLERKYEQGFAGALARALRLLEGQDI